MAEFKKKYELKNLWTLDNIEAKEVNKTEISKNNYTIAFLADSRSCLVEPDCAFMKIYDLLPHFKFRMLADPANPLVAKLSKKDNIIWFLPFKNFKQDLDITDFESKGNNELAFKIVRWLADEHYTKIPGIVRALQSSYVECILGKDLKTSAKIVLVNTKANIEKPGENFRELGTLYRVILMCEKLGIDCLSIYDPELESKLKILGVLTADQSLKKDKGYEIKVDEDHKVNTDTEDILKDIKEGDKEIKEVDLEF